MSHTQYPWALADAQHRERRAELLEEIRGWGLDTDTHPYRLVKGTMPLGDIMTHVPDRFEAIVRSRILSDKALVIAVAGSADQDALSQIDKRSANEKTALLNDYLVFLNELGLNPIEVAKYGNRTSHEIEAARTASLAETPPLALIQTLRASLPGVRPKQDTRLDKLKTWFFDHPVFYRVIVVFLAFSAIVATAAATLGIWDHFFPP